MNEHLIIETPENLQLQAEIAGLGSRFLASLIDYLLIFAVMLCITLTLPQAMTDPQQNQWVIVAWFMVQFIMMTFYHLIFELMWNGQTPGKRRMGIRVVQSNGLPASPTAIIIRNLVRLFDFLPVFYSIGLVVTFATANTQRLGDLAGRTIVIYERPQIELRSIKQDLKVRYRRISTLAPVPADINIEPLSQEDRFTVINYLKRRDMLENHEHLAAMLAKKIANRMNYPNTVLGRDAETFLEWVARAFELRD